MLVEQRHRTFRPQVRQGPAQPSYAIMATLLAGPDGWAVRCGPRRMATGVCAGWSAAALCRERPPGRSTAGCWTGPPAAPPPKARAATPLRWAQPHVVAGFASVRQLGQCSRQIGLAPAARQRCQRRRCAQALRRRGAVAARRPAACCWPPAPRVLQESPSVIEQLFVALPSGPASQHVTQPETRSQLEQPHDHLLSLVRSTRQASN